MAAQEVPPWDVMTPLRARPPAQVLFWSGYSMGVSGNGEHFGEKVVRNLQPLHAHASERGESRRERTPRPPRFNVVVAAPHSALAASTGPEGRPAGCILTTFRSLCGPFLTTRAHNIESGGGGSAAQRGQCGERGTGSAGLYSARTGTRKYYFFAFRRKCAQHCRTLPCYSRSKTGLARGAGPS